MKIPENFEEPDWLLNRDRLQWSLSEQLKNEGAFFQQDYWETEFIKLSKEGKKYRLFAESHYSASARE